MSIFKKAEEKKLLTVLEAYQQAFGGVPDNARCYHALDSGLGPGGVIFMANMVIPEVGHFYWKNSKWFPVKKHTPKYEITNMPAIRFKGLFKKAPQFDRLLEKTEKGISNKSDYLKLFDGEDY